MRIVVVIAARRAGMQVAARRALLQHMIERVQAARLPDLVVVATTPGAIDSAWRHGWELSDPLHFHTRNVCLDGGFDYARRFRLALDHAEDYALIRGVYERLWSPRRHFTLGDVLDLVEDMHELPNAMHV